MLNKTIFYDKNMLTKCLVYTLRAMQGLLGRGYSITQT